MSRAVNRNCQNKGNLLSYPEILQIVKIDAINGADVKARSMIINLDIWNLGENAEFVVIHKMRSTTYFYDSFKQETYK